MTIRRDGGQNAVRQKEMKQGIRRCRCAGHSLRRGTILSGVAQGIDVARLKQFSGHAWLKGSKNTSSSTSCAGTPGEGCDLTPRRPPQTASAMTL
jgi:hypothetical protein